VCLTILLFAQGFLSEPLSVKQMQPGELRLADLDRPSESAYVFGPFRLIPKERKLFLANEPVHVGSRAFAILVALVERAGTVVPGSELIQLVWPGVVVEEANLRVQLGTLRKVLARSEGGRNAIETVPLRGYCFVLPVFQTKTDPATPIGVDAEHNLPTSLTPTVGRDDAIELVSKSLASHRLVTIIGPGGIGKTTVALAVARQSLTLFADGARFVELSAVSEPRLVPSALASALGIGVLSEDPLGGLLAHLRGKEMLLLLDTCEHVVSSAAALSETLLTGLPDIRILATSREALRAKGEWVHRLPSLTLPPAAAALTAASALAYPSVELFVQQASANLDRFELKDADAPIVAEICRRLDGIPLAIELAAARVDELGPRQIAARLHETFLVLTRGRRTALPRHQTLSATLRWSYDLLEPEERAMLRQLAIFRGSFAADAAAAVVEHEADGRRHAMHTLSNLFVKSLLTADADSEVVLYRMLDTTRAFAAEELAEAGELTIVSRRHAAYVCAALRDAEKDLEAQDIPLWIGKYGHLIEDVRGALDWAMSPTGDREIGGLITSLSASLWFALSLLEEYGRRIEVALAAASEYADSAIEIGLLDALGHVAWHTRGDMAAMKAHFTKALAGAMRNGLAESEYRALYGLIVYFATNGDYVDAVSTSQQLGALAAALQDQRKIVAHRRLSVVASTFAGDHRSVRDHAHYVLSHSSSTSGKTRPSGMFFDQRISARTMLARTLWQQGFADQARDCAQEALALAQSTGHALSLCFVLAHAATPIALWCGELKIASEMTGRLLMRAEEHSFFIWREFGRAYDAVLQRAANASPRPGQPAMGALLLETLATLDEDAADDVILKRGERGIAGWCVPELLRIAGKRLLGGNEEDRARGEALLWRSLDAARQQGALSWELRSATSIAEWWFGQNRRREAVCLLTNTLDRFTEGFETADLVRAAVLLKR
jgi:predicted ATPase